MSAVRLLYVAEQLRRRVPGGIGTYTRALLRGLDAVPARDAVDVTLFASRHPGGPEPLARFGRPVVTSRLPSVLAARAWPRGLDRTPPGYDVVFSTALGAPHPAAEPGGRSAPVGLMVHDLAWRSFPEATTAHGRRWHERALADALAMAAGFTVPSAPVAAELVAAGAPAGAVRVIEHGADHLPAPDAQGAAGVVSAAGAEGGFLLSAATLEPRKNLRRLLEAYAAARGRLPEPLPLLVVGPRGWGADELGTDRSVFEGVVPVGTVSDAVLAGLYERATAFVYVPLAEGFGLPPVEAMHAGVPVVASSAVPSVRGPGDGPPAALVVDAADVDAIAAALCDVTADTDVRQRLVAAGAERAGALTWAATARAHVTMWQDLARASR